MRRYHQKNHAIDLLFTIGLFCVFAVSALLVTLAGASLYQKTNSQADLDYHIYTGLSYLEEKVRQHDYPGGVTVERLDGLDTLCLHETYGEDNYTTYIYVLDQKLTELFLREGMQPSPEDGTALMDAESLTLEQPEEGLLKISLSYGDGSPETLLLHLNAAGMDGRADT